MADYKIYGVKNDDEIIKLLEILDLYEVPYDFYDFREFPPTNEQLDSWAEFERQDFPINERSTFVKKQRKNFGLLEHEEKYEWIRKHHQIILRPIITNMEDEILSIGGRPERLLKTIFSLDPKGL